MELFNSYVVAEIGPRFGRKNRTRAAKAVLQMRIYGTGKPVP
jgi:hypothetical protein